MFTMNLVRVDSFFSIFSPHSPEEAQRAVFPRHLLTTILAVLAALPFPSNVTPCYTEPVLQSSFRVSFSQRFTLFPCSHDGSLPISTWHGSSGFWLTSLAALFFPQSLRVCSVKKPVWTQVVINYLSLSFINKKETIFSYIKFPTGAKISQDISRSCLLSPFCPFCLAQPHPRARRGSPGRLRWHRRMLPIRVVRVAKFSRLRGSPMTPRSTRQDLVDTKFIEIRHPTH